MHTRRLVKRSILGSRVYAPSPTGDGAPVTGVVQAVKQENRDASAAGARRSVYTVLLQDGSLNEFTEEEIAAGFNHTAPKGPLKSSLKVREQPGRPAGSASLLLCGALRRLTASCSDRSGTDERRRRRCRFLRIRPENFAKFCKVGRTLHPETGCHDIWRQQKCGTKGLIGPAQCSCGLIQTNRLQRFGPNHSWFGTFFLPSDWTDEH